MSLIRLKNNNFHIKSNNSKQKNAQTEAMTSSDMTNNFSNFNININLNDNKNNTSYHNSKNFNTKNNMNINKHIIIPSKNIQKKIPNLIKNVHHKPKIAISCDNFRYQPMTSFEQKLSKQLNRISNNYTTLKNRKFFNKANENTGIYWQNFADYEIYRQLKELDTRKEIPHGFPKPKLKPLIINSKDKLGKLAKNLYEADQVERFKTLLYKYKINKGKSF